MRILLLNRDEKSHVGGDMIQLHAYRSALEKLGHVAEYQGVLNPNVEGFDIAWLFHINFGWTKHQYKKVKGAGVPYYLFAIFYPFIIENSKEEMIELFNGAQKVFCLSHAEKEELENFLNLSVSQRRKIFIIPNGVDKNIFNDRTPQHERSFVVSVGRYEYLKGFDHVAKACQIIKAPVKIIGPKSDKNLVEELSRLDRVELIDSVPQNELAEILQKCKVYVCASESERNNLSILEAHACGCQIISSTGNRGNEWLGGVDIVNPEDENFLASKILEYLEDSEYKRFKIYDWQEVVDIILKI